MKKQLKQIILSLSALIFCSTQTLGQQDYIQGTEDVPNCEYNFCHSDWKFEQAMGQGYTSVLETRLEYRVSDTDGLIGTPYKPYPQGQTIVVKPGTYIQVRYNQAIGSNSEWPLQLGNMSVKFSKGESSDNCEYIKEAYSNTLPNGQHVADVNLADIPQREIKFQADAGGTYAIFAEANYPGIYDQNNNWVNTATVNLKISFNVPYLNGPLTKYERPCYGDKAMLEACNFLPKTGATENDIRWYAPDGIQLISPQDPIGAPHIVESVEITGDIVHFVEHDYTPPWQNATKITARRAVTVSTRFPIPEIVFDMYPIDCYGHGIAFENKSIIDLQPRSYFDTPLQIHTSLFGYDFGDDHKVHFYDSKEEREGHIFHEYDQPDDYSGFLFMNYEYKEHPELGKCPSVIINKPFQLTVATDAPTVRVDEALPTDCLGFNYEFKAGHLAEELDDLGTPKYTWDFGNGNKIETPNIDPTATNPYTALGTYHVIVTAHYEKAGCTSTALNVSEPISALVNGFAIDEEFDTDYTTQNFKDLSNGSGGNDVLGISATTFEDSWLLKTNSIAIQNDHAFQVGLRGVWRPNASYAYLDNRNQEATMDNKLNIAWQGGFNPNTFSWRASSTKMDYVVPNWVRSAQMTQYNAFGYELENKDALDRYSAAIYGYSGQLATAVGANTKYLEMAYSGFEEESTGNFQLRVNMPQDGKVRDYIKEKLITHKVIGATDDLILLELDYHDLLQFGLNNSGEEQYGVLKGVSVADATNSFALNHVKIECRYQYNQQNTEKKSLAFLNVVGLDEVGPWQGELGFYQDIASAATPATDAKIVSVKDGESAAHTGENSLAVYNDVSFPQPHLELEAGKKYVISAWVRVANKVNTVPSYASTDVTDPLRIGINWEGQNEELEIHCVPTGRIIEGWQRIEKVFEVPAGMTTEDILINFHKGSENSGATEVIYFDDLRLFPANGNMQSYVYDTSNFRLMATLDNNNYATLYSYDAEGNLFLIRKETARGIKTIQESVGYQKGSQP